MTKLKPCPWCGKEPYAGKYRRFANDGYNYYIECRNENCLMSEVKVVTENNSQQAIKAWETRTP